MALDAVSEEVMFGEAAQLHPLEEDELKLLQSDMDLAREVLEAEVSSKLDFWQRLPWLMAGLAQVDVEAAREIAHRVLSSFAKDPRECAHHRMTWHLLRPGASFREELEKFAGGARRTDCSEEFLRQVAVFKLMPISETSIEGRHARVAMAMGKQSMGPVRVSLANRMGMLETRLLRDEGFGQELLSEFAAARSIKKIATMLNLEGHPLYTDLDVKHTNVAALRPILTAMIYHCDLEARYFSMHEFMRGHDKKKRSRQGKIDRMCRGAQTVLSHSAIRRATLLDHLRQHLKPGVVYSVPRGTFQGSQSLLEFLDQPGTQWQRGAGDLGDDMIVDVEAEDEDTNENMFSVCRS